MKPNSQKSPLSKHNIPNNTGSVITAGYRFSVVDREIVAMDGHWYVTHTGLLRLAHRRHCSGIQTEVISELSDSRSGYWVIKATVFPTPHSTGFVGYGDATPNNVSPLVRGAELRIAETRAVNRALRKAYGIGLCSVEELGAVGASPPEPPIANHNGNGQPRLRDRLLLLIRRYELDADEVKQYAVRFCGSANLREAHRTQIEKLITHLSALGARGRDELLAELRNGKSPAAAPPKSATSEESSSMEAA